MTCADPSGHQCACHHGGLDTPCDIPGGCGLAAAQARIDRRRHRIGLQLANLGVDVDELTNPAGYLRQIRGLLPEHGTPLTDAGDGGGTHGGKKVIGSPAPWNDNAAGWLFDVHAGARRHEAVLRRELAFRPATRSGSDRSTVLALLALPALCAAVLDHAARRDMDVHLVERTIRDTGRWCTTARRILDEDPRPHERTQTFAPGGLTCPHCERRLVLRPGWQYEQAPPVWCQRCPSTVDDDHPRGRDLSWEAGAWLAVLQQNDVG